MSVLPRVAVLDYGAGNLHSVITALARSGCRPEVCADAAALKLADALVLPGAGAFRSAASQLAAKGLDAALRDAIAAGRPYLGLCLGLQLLFDESDEHGATPGLGILPGVVRRLPERVSARARPGANETANAGAAETARTHAAQPVRVPHIGWNRVAWRGAHPLLAHLPAAEDYYFVHAYSARPARVEDEAGVAEHGAPFTAAVARDNVFAVQFHPEKSQRAGLRLLEAFIRWVKK